ncbi:MAG: pyridoxamine 5'-phosphate oxidase family protein [Phycisphaeraceae bacterium]
MIASLPPQVVEAWQHRAGPCVLATVDRHHQPNVIYVGQIQRYSESAFMIADVHFHKTRQNIESKLPGALLFITDEKKSYQFRGRFTVHTTGPEFDHLQTWLDPQHGTPHAAVVLHVEQVFQGAMQLA